MSMITLSTLDLVIASLLVVVLAALSLYLRLGVTKQLTVAAIRTVVQLLLIGLILDVLFEYVHIAWVALLALIMLGLAGREAMARQQRRLTGWWGYGVGTFSMFLSSFTLTVLGLAVIIGPEPWYEPQYSIPLLGMLLGNTMTGIALGVDRLTQGAWQQRAALEGRLLMGMTWHQAVEEVRRDAVRSGMIPMINAMAAAGIISLPGMMTGQILAGAPPIEAVKYQILIMFLITGGTGFGTFAAVWFGARRLFDNRQRLRLDRLTAAEDRL